MTTPILSIITPSFNQAPFLRQTLESVAGQPVPPGSVEHLGASRHGLHDVVHLTGESAGMYCEIAMQFNDSYNELLLSFANNIRTVDGGTIAGRRVRARDVELTTTDGKITLEAEAPLRGRMVIASLRGDVDVKLRRHGAVSVRARAARLDLGSSLGSAKPGPNGWVEGHLGVKSPAQAAIVELRSRYGFVQFAVIE